MKVFAKKNIIKLLAIIFCIAFFLTGCATVSNVTDKNGKKIYFDDVEYFEGHIAVVGDYLYYGNGYTSSSDEGFNYNDATSSGYLARLNISNQLKYDYTEDEDGYYNPSPAGIEQVNDEKLIGYQNQYMFALGEYLYFTSANTHKTSSLENDYSQVSLFRVKFNGDKFKEIDTFRYDENSVITVQKGSDGNYYYIIYSPTSSEENPTYNLYSIRIGDKIGDTVTLAEEVKSVAVCDENSTVKNIVYTVDSERTEYATDAVKAVDFATGEVSDYGDNNDVVGSTTTMLGRVGDVVVYNYSSQIVPQGIFYKDISTGDKHFSGTTKFYTSNSTISDIQTIGDGYMFISDVSSSVMYKSTLDTTVDAQTLLRSADYSDILFVDGDWLYYSNDTTISRINVRDKKQETLATMTRLISGQCGYDGNYIYFYAQIEQETDGSDSGEGEDGSTETTTDSKYYMHRVDKEGNVQLLANADKIKKAE